MSESKYYLIKVKGKSDYSRDKKWVSHLLLLLKNM